MIEQTVFKVMIIQFINPIPFFKRCPNGSSQKLSCFIQVDLITFESLLIDFVNLLS